MSWNDVRKTGFQLKAPKTLRVFTVDEGAEEHCQMGNMTLLHQVLFDWLDAMP